MTEFTKKSLNNNNGFGAKLKAAREFRQISPEAVARRLNIRLEYLLAIESDHFSLLPSGLYSKNYIKDYAALLGFSKTETKKWLNENLEIVNENSDPFSQKIVRSKEFIVFPKIIKNLILFLVFLTCLLYLAFYLRKIFFPPILEIYQPKDNLRISESFIEIKGLTEAEAELSINGEAVLNTNQGNFSSTINLKRGINNLVIKAKKKYSGEALITKQILVE